MVDFAEALLNAAVGRDPNRFGKDPDGFLVDLNRPIVKPPEGMKGEGSSEVGITVMARELGLSGSRWYNIPSIISGKHVGDGPEAREDAKRRVADGWVFPNFATEPEASAASSRRSSSLFDLRKAAGKPTRLGE